MRLIAFDLPRKLGRVGLDPIWAAAPQEK